MSDYEIQQSCAKHYPNWRTDPLAAEICHLICDLVTWRARATALVGTEDSRITHLCFTIGIPKSTFEEVKNALHQS